MRRIAIIATCCLLAAPVLAQSIGEKTGVNAMLGVSPSTADFATQAAISDMFEIQTSQLAQERAIDEATKTFARQMITEHEKTTGELKALLASSAPQVTPPPAMDGAHMSLLDKLKTLNGEDFTKQYHSDQVEAHEDAVALFERYADGGDNPSIREWAGKTLPALRHHLEMAEGLNK